jgi:hypothetical protein
MKRYREGTIVASGWPISMSTYRRGSCSIRDLITITDHFFSKCHDQGDRRELVNLVCLNGNLPSDFRIRNNSFPISGQSDSISQDFRVGCASLETIAHYVTFAVCLSRVIRSI